MERDWNWSILGCVPNDRVVRRGVVWDFSWCRWDISLVSNPPIGTSFVLQNASWSLWVRSAVTGQTWYLQSFSGTAFLQNPHNDWDTLCCQLCTPRETLHPSPQQIVSSIP